MPRGHVLDLPAVPWWLAALLAAAGALALEAAFPDRGVWILAPVGIGAILVSLIGRTAASAFVLGLIAGVTFWLVHIAWLTLYLGPIPWLALGIFESLFFAVSCSAIAVVYRRATALWGSGPHRVLTVPVVVAGLWVARESLTSVFPEGGFAWGRVAFSQSVSPLGPLVAWVGIAGLTFLIVWSAAFVIELVRARRYSALARVLVAVAAATVLVAIPSWPAPTEGTMRVGAVQGNSRAGLFDRGEPGSILSDHAAESLKLRGENLDVLVWPENASDLNPERFPRAAATLDYVSEAVEAPIAVGTITLRGDDVYNTSLLWQAYGQVLDYYDKRHPVPFAEYMPMRPLFHAIVPDLVDLVTRDYTKGTTDAIFDIDGVPVGITICFDITDDALAREYISDGAQIIFAQTNNADFGRTDENLQQLSIARIRAMETGRSVVNISTVGTSQIIGPDGSTLAAIPAYEPGSMVADVPLSRVLTPASLLGLGIELSLAGLGLAGLVLAVTTVRSVPRNTHRESGATTPDSLVITTGR